MKNMTLFLTLICFVHVCVAQNNRFYIGTYFSWEPEFGHYKSDGTRYTIWKNTYNLNGGYQFSKRWKVGGEVMLIDVKGDYAPTPFFLGGIHTDYDFIHTPKFNFALRGGMSIGNLNHIDQKEPEKGLSINAVLGLTFEHELYKKLWFMVGAYRHYPIYQNHNKYSFLNAFIGFRYWLGKHS